MPAPRVARVVLAAIVVAALALRIVLALATPFPRIDGDPAVYDEIAVAIASGHGFARRGGRPTALHPPGWPSALGIAYAVTGHGTAADRASTARPGDPRAQAQSRGRWRAGRILQALLGGAAVALLGVVAWQLWGWRVAIAAAAVGALYAPLAVLGLGLVSEPLFVVLELGALAAALAQRRAGGRRWAAVAGVLLGATTLTRNNGVVLALPLVLLVWTGRPRWSRRALAAPAVLLATAALAILPWLVRNAVVFDAFVPVATNFGQTLEGTYNAESADHYYRWRSPRRLPPARRAGLRGLDEAERSAALARDGWSYIRAHPEAPLVAALENSARLVEIDPGGRAVLAQVIGSRALMHVSVAGFVVCAALALVGAFTRRARAAPRAVWLMPLLLGASVVALAVVFSRFRAPLDPFLVLLAALAVSRLR